MVKSRCLSSLTNDREVRASWRQRPAYRSRSKAGCGGAQPTHWASVTQDPVSVLILLVNLNLTFPSTQVLCFCSPRIPGKFSPLPTGSTLYSSLTEVLTASQTHSCPQDFACSLLRLEKPPHSSWLDVAFPPFFFDSATFQTSSFLDYL